MYKEKMVIGKFIIAIYDDKNSVYYKCDDGDEILLFQRPSLEECLCWIEANK